MSAGHTPGPWYAMPAGAVDDDPRWLIQPAATDTAYAIAITVGGNDEANARMLAAAPALADALAEYIEEVERDGWPSAEWSNANLERMRAALRLARRTS